MPILLQQQQKWNCINITSTEIYTHEDNEQIRNAVNSNPLSNFKVKICENEFFLQDVLTK